ncbi:MAG: hypothetical protein AAB886_00540, partial [Patescibacteria group bacterium]
MSRAKQFFKTGIIVWAAVVLIVSSLARPNAAFAQLTVTSDLIRDPFLVKKNVEEAVKKPLEVALIQILVNLISFVANRLAYDAAMAIATGGKGQGPNFEYRSVEDYFQDLGNDILGESIGSLSQGLDTIGIKFDVCAPPDPRVRFNIQLGIAEGANTAAATRAPRCDWKQIQQNWAGFIERAKDNEAGTQYILQQASAMFQPGQTDFSAAVTIVAKTMEDANLQSDLKTDEMLKNERFKSVEGFISGNVETPSSVLQEQFQTKLKESQGAKTEALKGALFGSEGALLQIGVSAGSVFLNTLLSQLTNKIYTGLFNPPSTGGVFNPEFINTANRAAARETFKDLFTTSIETIDNYNVVNQFVTCPGENRTINNCVIDTSFAAAIARSDAGSPMTIREAMDANLLHGDWPLITSRDTSRNQDPFCSTR